MLASVEQVSGTKQDFRVTEGDLFPLHGNPKRDCVVEHPFPFTTASACRCSRAEAFSGEPGGQGLRDAARGRPPAALHSHGHARMCIRTYPTRGPERRQHCPLCSTGPQVSERSFPFVHRAPDSITGWTAVRDAQCLRPGLGSEVMAACERFAAISKGFVSPGPERAGTGFIWVPLHPEPSAEHMEGASKHGLHRDHQRHGTSPPVYFHVPTFWMGDSGLAVLSDLSEVTGR